MEMSNEILVSLVQQGINTVDNLELLYLQNLGLIHSVAKKYRHYAEIEDLIQEGFLAICEAAKKFDPAQGAFSTYLTYWLRQYMQRYIDNYSSCCRIPVHQRETINKYQRFITNFMAECDRKPSDREICHCLEINLKQLRQLKKDLLIANMDSLDRSLDGMEDSKANVGDAVSDDYDLEDDILDRMQREHLKREIWECVDSLETQQAEIIRDRYQNDMTLKAVGELRGVTTGMVSRIERMALRELRKPSRANRLRPFVDDYIRSFALRHNGVREFNQTWTSSTEYAALKIMEFEERQQKVNKC